MAELYIFARRVELHNQLCAILERFGLEPNVYFQPPATVRLAYPCILYALSDIDTKFADNVPYAHQRRYSLTLIDRNPDSPIVDKLLQMPRCAFDRVYTADNLYHFAFNIYF